MRIFGIRGVSAALVLSAAVLWAMPGTGSAFTLYTMCVPETPGKPVVSPVAGQCPPKKTMKYAPVVLPNPEGQINLIYLLEHMKFVESGVGGKPTIQLSGVNVQIINGAGKTDTTNGEGNLVVGYDEEPGEQTGSHDLMVGTKQTFTSYSSILGGWHNSATAPRSVAFGEFSRAEGEEATVLGGQEGLASGVDSVVVGGLKDQATDGYATAGGGFSNIAGSKFASAGGGRENKATGAYASVSGGDTNTAGGFAASVSGGAGNTATGEKSSILGGGGNVASGYLASVAGGYKNTAAGSFSAILGGALGEVTAEFGHFP
jgi:hypothetical protein